MGEVLDDREDYGEERFLLIGMVEDQLISMVYTDRRGRFRLITAMSKTTTSRRTAKTKPDLRPIRSMRATEIEAAARSDPDARPFTAAELARAKHTPRAKLIRRALGLTQEEFAKRFEIPLGTLRDWEQGAAEPDQAARAYLKVIAHDPESVRKALGREPRP